MNSVLTALCGAINFVPPWIMLGVFGAIILFVVIFIVFKGIKRGVKFIILGIALMALAYLVYVIVQFAKWEPIELIGFAIRWLPTILFVLTVFIATVIGVWRGLRKSLLLALHATCAGAVCVAFFFIMVNVKEVDAGMLGFINFFMGGDGALQRALGVPETCSTLKQVLSYAVPLIFGSENEFALILRDNAAYIYTLVDMAYRIIIAVLSLLIYFSLLFTLYIVYHLCYSQRKYKKNRILEFQNGKTDRNYRKHRIGGGVVGCVRGIAVGLLSLSFLGSAFYAVAGGKGEGKLEEHDFGNDDANFIYEIYRSIDSYGAQGIFSVLNMMTDASDAPFYLFAADLIFSGELNDEEAGVYGDVSLREELAAYSGFARDTLALLMKYGSDELDGIVGGEATGDAFNTVVTVMAKPEFRNEFNALIDAFDSQTYIINLSMSLVNSIVNNIDEVSFANVGDGEKELLKVIFKKGYLSAEIPDERALIENTGTNIATGANIRPYLTVNHLLTKNDVKTALNVALSVIAGETSDDAVEAMQSLMPEIAKLSILQSERKNEFNPVLGRMYCLFENEYLTLDGEDGVTYSEIAADGIDWIGEINTLLDISSDAMTLYNNMYAEDVESLDVLKSLFDKNNENYEENMRIYDKINLSLSDSRVLGRALSTGWFYITLIDALSAAFDDLYLPRDLVYNNVYGTDGELISYGELYKMMSGLKLMCGDWSVFDTLSGASEENIGEILKTISGVLTESDGKYNLSYYLVESTILRSVISVALIETGGNTFYVPKSAREKVNGVEVNLINKSDFSGLLENMNDLVDFVMPFVGDSEEWKDRVDTLLENIYDLVQRNVIFEGTVAQILNEKLKVSILTVPKSLAGDVENWLSEGNKPGELLLFLDALQTGDFNFSGVLTDGDVTSDGILECLLDMDEDELEQFFSSSVIQYSVSKYLIEDGESIEGFKVIVPANARTALGDDVISSIVKKSELVYAFSEISRLGLNGDGDENFTSLLIKIAKNKSVLSGSKMIAASIAATLVEKDDGSLGIPADLLKKGTPEELEYFDSTNPWSTELVSLVNALDEIFDLQNAGDDLDISSEMSEKISTIIPTLNNRSGLSGLTSRTRLEVLYESLIVRNKITEELDNVFTEELVESYVVNYVKIGGYYSYDELKALSDAANALGIENTQDFNEDKFDSIDFNEKVEGGNETVLQVIYRSDVVAGIITSNLLRNMDTVLDDDGKQILYDHPYAYRTDLKVYKECEIETIAALFENIGSIQDLDFDKLSEYILDENGETKSYLIVASVSEQLLTSRALIIPHTVVNAVGGKKYVNALELKRFVDAFNALINTGKYDFDSVDGFSEDTVLEIPGKDVRDILFESEIIRARITWQLNKMNLTSGGILAVGSENGSIVADQRAVEYSGVGNTATISKEQLEYLAAALEVINGEDAVSVFEVPEIDLGSLSKKDKSDIDKVLQSDLIRYKVCEALTESGITFNFVNEEVLNISTLSTEIIKAATTEAIKEALDRVSEFY